MSGRDRIWSEETGPAEGALVALVHGSMDRSAGLLKLSRRLHDVAHVLRYDRRGYGRSSPHPGPYGMDEQVADLVDLLDGRRALLFGHSYGGDVALAAADRRPELVTGVVVYETPLSWLDWWPGTTAGEAALAMGASPADAAERFMRRLIGDGRWERLPSRTRAARRDEGVAMVGELTDLRSRSPWDPARIDVPVVAVHGEQGAEHHRRAMAYLAGELRDCTVVEIAGARHFGPNTHPDAVAAIVRELMSITPGAPPPR
jgi:pimeloyl-ACP methyl ester carboxylesterase